MLGALAAPRWFQISCLKGQETIQLRSKSAEKAGWLGCGLCHAACCHYFKTTHLIFDFFPVFQVRRPRCSCTAPWCPCLRQTPSHYFQLFFSIFLVRSACSSCAASWFPCLHQNCQCHVDCAYLQLSLPLRSSLIAWATVVHLCREIDLNKYIRFIGRHGNARHNCGTAQWETADCHASSISQGLGTQRDFAAMLRSTVLGHPGRARCGVAGRWYDSFGCKRTLTCVARFPCLASTWKAFALWCHNDRVVTWGHPAYGSDSSGVCKRLRKVVQIVASGRAFAAVTSYGSVVTWGLPKMVADTAMVRQQLYDVRSVTAAAQGETQVPKPKAHWVSCAHLESHAQGIGAHGKELDFERGAQRGPTCPEMLLVQRCCPGWWRAPASRAIRTQPADAVHVY